MTNPLLLVVDDEKDMAEFIGDVGKAAGFDAEITTSGKEFQDIYLQKQPDVIVMDVMMPDLDGYDLLKWQSERNCKVPTILISGFDSSYLEIAETAGNGMMGNIVGTLGKPFSFDDMEQMLKKALAVN